ncbi:HTH-type transcriptional regulator BetI [Devosia pacifica]|uniref:HTH-type transcriptional regulator BetI n=2 Tax=Devosia pacifica TaxID=1335967 RepID=A0A918S597_9HYPH|nr:transcriptional regulator BetI [Devosia pacifica]GHA21285.1 HTH-type transcriptional regulator BetI [Devosia pacifica]
MPILRRQALISATIAEIGEAGTLDVTVSQIARRAGMSSALAHHYFGSKDQIFLSAMRHVLETFRLAVRARLIVAKTPEARIRAIIDASFESSQFEREIVAAWLAFYVRALQSGETRRLLQVYSRRLHSNLMVNLRQLFDADTAQLVAQGLASMIDGFYIRHALQDAVPDREGSRDMVNDYLQLWLERKRRS